MAIAMLLLMPFAWRTAAAPAPAGRAHRRQRPAGIWQMTGRAILTAAMVLCAWWRRCCWWSRSPIWLGNVLGMNLRPVLLMLDKLKEWVMLDIYLVGIGVASIKVQDYAFLQPGIGLVAFISLTLLSILTLIHMNVEELWERFIPSARRPAPIKSAGVHRLPLHRLSRRARPLPTLPHAAAQTPPEPAAQLGGADCLAGFPAAGQPAADLDHLRQRRASG
jgi:uncharacterized paraquat-inducible protein A